MKNQSFDTGSHPKADVTTVPEIRREGRWLEELGFKQGQKVNIQTEANKLTITVENGNNE